MDSESFQNGQMKRLIAALTLITVLGGLVIGWSDAVTAVGVATRDYHRSDVRNVRDSVADNAVTDDSLLREVQKIKRLICAGMESETARYREDCPR